MLLGTPGTIILLVGVSLVVELWANGVIANILKVIPYIVIAVGIVFIVDALMSTIFTCKKDKKAFLYMLPELIIGVIALVLGILCLVKGENGQSIINESVQLIVLGVIVCLYAVYDFLLTVIKLPKAVLIASISRIKTLG